MEFIRCCLQRCAEDRMNASTLILQTIFVILELLPLVNTKCGNSQYFNVQTSSCEPCTKCPDNTNVVSECTNTSNTVCAIDSNFFGDSFKWLHELEVKPQDDSPVETITKSDSEHWKKLAFSLIGALCVLVVIATIVVIISCRRHFHCSSEKYNNNRSSLDLRGENEGESEYVVIRRQPSSISYMANEQPHPLSGVPHIHQGRYQRLRRIYRPQRRLMNEYVDDVFESEDSGGSRTGARLPLHTIPERSDSEGREIES